MSLAAFTRTRLQSQLLSELVIQQELRDVGRAELLADAHEDALTELIADGDAGARARIPAS